MTTAPEDMRPNQTIQVEATILGVKHHGTSVNGNPQYKVRTDKGTWATKPDAGIAYGVTNWSPYVSENIYCTVTLTLHKLRKHTYVTNIEGPDTFDLRHP